MFNLPGNHARRSLIGELNDAGSPQERIVLNFKYITPHVLIVCAPEAEGMIHNIRLIGRQVSIFPTDTFWSIIHQALMSNKK